MHRRLFVVLFFSFFVFWFFSSFVGFSYAGALIYSTFLGGGSYDYGYDIAIDSSRNVYITGMTGSTDFPTTYGAFDQTHNGSYNYDVFVTKLNASGTALVYSTYLGGVGNDYGNGIAIDGSGNAYITGWTQSSDFPTHSAVYSSYRGGTTDVFVTKLNASGTALVYSTYLGGGRIDYGYSIALDVSGNIYITGYTDSSDFPTTPGAFEDWYSGYHDVFVTKLNANGTALVYSTFLGGWSIDEGYGITIDSSGNAYITGMTKSPNFPTTPSAYDTTYNTDYYYNEDVFVSKLNASGTALVYSTYLGGDEGWDAGDGIAIDGSGNAYITGYTCSTDFPTTSGALDTSYNGGYWGDVFVTKLNASGTELLYSTYLGGGDDDYGYGIAIDSSGNAYITGITTSSDFPTTPSAFDTSFNGGSYDAFVSKLNASGTALLYSTYLGGGSSDWGWGIAIDGSENAYITGYTESSDFPTTPGAFDTLFNGGYYDVFVTKISRTYLNRCGDFTVSSDTSHWYFEKYGDGTNAGTLSWSSISWLGKLGVVRLNQNPGEKGKLTQVFSVPSTGWYTAIAQVATNVTDVNKQQKVYLYLQELVSNTTIAATGNQIIQPGSGGFKSAGVWKPMQISFYAQKKVLGVQVVGINPTNSGVTSSLYLDDIWVYAGGPTGTNPITLVNPSFDSGTTGWLIQPYGDAISAGSWTEWSRFLVGSQGSGEKGKASQLYSASTSETLGSIWVFSAATSMSQTQKIYLYIYSYDNIYSKIIESGNAILQPGKWTPGEWRQLQFGYTPLTNYNAVQLVGINPIGRPYQAIYFDDVELKQ